MHRRSTPADGPPIPDDLRCRRSNGKDWRCSEQALPDLSYCAYHHRLNYHRPSPSSASSGRRPSRRKVAGSPCLSRDGIDKADLVGDCAAGLFGDDGSLVKRRRRRRKEDLMGIHEMGSPNIHANKDIALLNVTGDESCLSDPIYDAVPVRCRPINESSITDLLSSNGIVSEMNTDELSISDTVFGALPVPDEYRCKRSNGKEWRCTEQALPGLSYCPYHHHLNYNRPPSKTKSTPRASRTKTIQQPDPSKILCRRTNGKGWQCPNPAVEGLSYCPYHHQLNYRGSTSGLAPKDASRISHINIKSQKVEPEEAQQRHNLLLDGLEYTF
ncbi:hypothetical protein LUZ63_000526 [Rhynchospora breviuscula]|uniref:Growth-regulating factor n=1 Tax=Rhynchospora breviuscula TaxID=2022672 RepID=A0A9Q0CW15_9POAL|nr:hypothetical protein LUZ63_000526 [Rhynchospora breviuscula]